MVEACGKLTGKPGVLLVTRGPGACNASIGVHTAFQDSTPMVVLVGQVARHQIDREAFQEVDFRKMYAPLAKWVTQIDLADRIPELMNQAFQVATSAGIGEITPQSYTLMGVPDPGKTLTHVHAAAEELGRVFRPTLAIQSGMAQFAAAAAALQPIAAPRWRQWSEAARAEYLAGLVPTRVEPAPALDLGRILTWLRERLPDVAVCTPGVA